MGEKLSLGSKHTILSSQMVQREKKAPHPNSRNPFITAHPLNLETGLGRSISGFKVLRVQLAQNGYSRVLQQRLFRRQKNPWSRP